MDKLYCKICDKKYSVSTEIERILQTLIDNVELEIKEIDRIFNESDLPDNVDENIINDLIIDIRKEVYKLNK